MLLFVLCTTALLLFWMQVLYHFVRIWRYAEEVEARIRKLGKNKSSFVDLNDRRIMGSNEEYEKKLEEKKKTLKDLESGYLETAPPIVHALSEESILMTGGAAAVFEQLAHPYVAFGVSSHSYLLTQDGIRRRFNRTFEFLFGINFGSWERAYHCQMAVRKMHSKIKGEIPCDLEGGVYKKGHKFDALSEPAAFWVYATLIYNQVISYETFMRRLSKEEKDTFYAWHRNNVEIWDVSIENLPKNWDEFEQYMCSMFHSPLLAPSAPAIEYTRILLLPLSFDLPGINSTRLAALLQTPEPIRKFLGLERSKKDFFLGILMASIVCVIYRLLPKRVRHFTKYRERLHRISDNKGLDWLERIGQRIGTFIVDTSLAR